MKFLGDPSSGSYQGKTFSRNRYGQYLRTRATPVNPNSAFQAAARARLGGNAADWRALTAIQRAGWLTLGLSMTRTDALGQTYNLNGFGAFCSVNNDLVAAGDAKLTAAPALITPTTLLTATITLTAAAASIAYTTTPLAAGNRLFAFMSPQRSPGRLFEADYRLIQVSAAAAASPANVFTAYQARFGTPVVTNKVFFSLQLYQGGFIGAPFLVSAIVA